MSKKNKKLFSYTVVPSWDKDGTDTQIIEASTPQEAIKKAADKFEIDPEDTFKVFVLVEIGTYKATPNYIVKKLPDIKR